jgi:F0F1-type ATP synthase assembly protein I
MRKKTEENIQEESTQAVDQPQSPGKGFGVAASPLNTVKLELAIVVIVGIVLGLVIGEITRNDWSDVLILGSYGLLAGIGLILRTRYLTSKYLQSREFSHTEERL